MSVTITEEGLAITKNIWYKILRLMLSLIGLTIFFGLLFKNLYSVIDDKTRLVITLLILISILYFGFVAYSIRNFVKNKNYFICLGSESIIVNDKFILSKQNSRITVDKNVNRYGTITFDIYLLDSNIKIKLIEGVDRKQKDESVKAIEEFLLIPVIISE